MKNFVLPLILVVSMVNGLQAQFDEYKYIVIPKKFEDFKSENQYKTSTIVKYLFTQKGFKTVYDDNLPVDLQANRCLGLVVSLIDKSSMFTTKTTLLLKDCSGVEVFSTIQGKSKQKEYELSYKEALENAFRSFNGVSYNYKPKTQKSNSEPLTVSFKNDVKKVQERPNLNKNRDPQVDQIATKEVQYYKDKRPVSSNYKKAPEATSKAVQQIATKEEQRFESNEPVTTADYKIKKAEKSTVSISTNTEVTVLYAQELANGYQLVDSTPKIRMKLLKSSSPNVFIAESGSTKGVVYSKNGQWVFEYYKANKLIIEQLNIKF